MPYDRASRLRRNHKSGFTLLETVVAFGLVALVLGASYGVIARSLSSQREAIARYQDVLMARSILDEYLLADLKEVSGTYKNTWEWHITETDIQRSAKTPYDQAFAFVDIQIVVRRIANGAEVQLSRALAKRAR